MNLQFMFMLMIFLMSILFFKMNHPLSMGMLLMLQTFFISLFCGFIYKTFWFSYSLFLIFMGGMLIIFMYMTSLASNEIFKFNLMKKKLFYFIIFFLLTLFFLINMKKIFFFNINNLESMNFKNLINLNFENFLTLNKFYNFPTNFITILLINYLFLTLIMSVKITNIFKGPLRMKK